MIRLKNVNYDKIKMEGEIETIKKILPSIESFNTFFANNDVFNMHTRRQVKKNNKLKRSFDNGMENTTRYLIFSRN